MICDVRWRRCQNPKAPKPQNSAAACNFGCIPAHTLGISARRCRPYSGRVSNAAGLPAGAHVKKESQKSVRIDLTEDVKKKVREQSDSDPESVELKVDQELEDRITPSIGTFF